MSEAQQKTQEPKVVIKDVSGDKTEAHKTAKDLKFTRTFTLECTEEDGTHRYGQFTVRRLSIGETARVGVLRAQLSGDVAPESLDETTWLLNEMIAYCRVAVVDSPEWFQPGEMFDVTVLQSVYKEGRSFQQSFRAGSVEQRRSEAPSNSGSEA